MLELVAGGDTTPSAARVAELAGVGLRSVFRHFDDMDALYSEMGQVIQERVRPIIEQPFAGATWQDRLFEVARRRARVFDMIMPYRISASIKRFQSPYLMQDYRRMLTLEGELVEAHLPDAVKADRAGARAIGVILGFQTWRLLRHDQELSAAEAQAVVARLLGDVLARMPDPA